MSTWGFDNPYAFTDMGFAIPPLEPKLTAAEQARAAGYGNLAQLDGYVPAGSTDAFERNDRKAKAEQAFIPRVTGNVDVNALAPELQQRMFADTMRARQNAIMPKAGMGMPIGAPQRGQSAPLGAGDQVLANTMGAVAEMGVPQSPLDYGLYAMGGPFSKMAKAGIVGLSGALMPSEAEAGPIGTIRKAAKRFAPAFQAGGEDVVNAGVNAPTNRLIQTVRDPYRMMFPGVYANPREIAQIAGARVIPEDPLLRQLWGVSRGDLDAMAAGRIGNEAPVVPPAGPRSRGAVAAFNVMTPRNEQRLGDILYEGGRIPGLKHADAWYIMDPMYQRLEQMFGREEAIKRYRHLNTMTGYASPGSDVMTEIQRGTGAHWLEQQGRFGDFEKYAGLPEVLAKKHKPGAQSRQMLGDEFPADMRYIVGHPYHGTAQSEPMANYLATGKTFNTGPKVPLYIQASGTPQTGFQTISPVGDAHFSRGVGLSDTRKGPTDVQGSFSVSESQTLQPWWQQKIAAQQGIESVPAQARLWTILGPQTGVDSPLGQGKLELFSKQIGVAAKRLGVSPEKARDMILSGTAGAGALAMMAPGLPETFSRMGGLAAQDEYQ